jgi:selenocysteine lyase/cysteine desulfurase
VSATTRASFALYNTAEEVDALCEAIEYARKVFRRK